MLMSACSDSDLSSALLISTPRLRSLPQLWRQIIKCYLFSTNSVYLICGNWSTCWNVLPAIVWCQSIGYWRTEIGSLGSKIFVAQDKCVHLLWTYVMGVYAILKNSCAALFPALSQHQERSSKRFSRMKESMNCLSWLLPFTFLWWFLSEKMRWASCIWCP